MLIPRGPQPSAIHGLPDLGDAGVEAGLWLAVTAALGALLFHPSLGDLIGPAVGLAITYGVWEWASGRS